MRPRAAVGVRTCRAKPQTAVLGALTDVVVGLNCKDLMTLRVITRRRAVTHAKGRDARVCLNLAGQSCQKRLMRTTHDQRLWSQAPPLRYASSDLPLVPRGVPGACLISAILAPPCVSYADVWRPLRASGAGANQLQTRIKFPHHHPRSLSVFNNRLPQHSRIDPWGGRAEAERAGISDHDRSTAPLHLPINWITRMGSGE